jgi:rod shape-determining protein MreC
VDALRSRALLIILILSLTLMWLTFDQVSTSNPVRDAFSGVLAPVQYVFHRMTQPIARTASWIRNLHQLQDENERLQREVVTLRNQIMLLQEAQIENETLRRHLDFKSAVPNWQQLSAEVIGRDPNNMMQYLIIDRGTADGVAVGMPVLVNEGLVGRISEAGRNSARVMLITDSSSSVSALIQRSRATGVIQGYPGGELLMRYIPQDEPVMIGDIVLTAGLGGNFPRRLPIGQVVSVKIQDVAMFQEARIAPAVQLRGLESVVVLLNFSAIDTEEGILPPQ